MVLATCEFSDVANRIKDSQITYYTVCYCAHVAIFAVLRFCKVLLGVLKL